MTSSRRLRIGVATAFAALLLAAIPAISAAASAGTVVIEGVSSPPEESGLLSIQAEAPTAINSLAAYIYSGSALELTLPSSDFALSSGDATDGTWTLTAPIVPAQLSLGTYSVEVYATDSGGDSVASAAGSFFYGLDPVLTLTASTTTLSYFQQDVALSGTVTAYEPDGSQLLMAGQAVTISGAGGQWTATTNAAGVYFLDVTPDVASGLGNVTAAVSSSPTMLGAVSPAVGLTAQVDPVQVTVGLSAQSADFGQTVTIYGVALIQSDGQWIPFAGAGIDIGGTEAYSGRSAPPVTADTDSNGGFSVALPGSPTTTWYADPPPNGYLDPVYPAASGGPNSATLTVLLPTALTPVTVHYTPSGQVAVAGCLALAPAVASFDVQSPSGAALQLQYSRTASSGWRTLTALTTGGTASCGGAAFSDTVQPPALSGYYRVSYAGEAPFEPAVSASYHAATVPTRFSSFSIKPAASGHGRVTASGKLEMKAPGWTGLGGAPITLYVELHGKGWYWFKKLHVSKSGTFSVIFVDSASAHWAIGYAGDGTHLATISRIFYAPARATSVSAAERDILATDVADDSGAGHLEAVDRQAER